MKEFLVYVSCLVGLMAAGVWFAKRWVVSPGPAYLKYPRWIRIGALIVSMWMGTFLAHGLARRINSELNDGIAYDEGAELPYEVMYDGVGDNVMCLFFGWLAGFICWSIAAGLKSKDRPS